MGQRMWTSSCSMAGCPLLARIPGRHGRGRGGFRGGGGGEDYGDGSERYRQTRSTRSRAAFAAVSAPPSREDDADAEQCHVRASRQRGPEECGREEQVNAQALALKTRYVLSGTVLRGGRGGLRERRR